MCMHVVDPNRSCVRMRKNSLHAHAYEIDAQLERSPPSSRLRSLANTRRMAAALLLWCCAALLAPLALSQTLDPSPAPPSEGCPGPTESGVLCYLSTECRGGVVPGDGGTVSTVAECCGGARRGLSYCDEEGCENCFSELVSSKPMQW